MQYLCMCQNQLFDSGDIKYDRDDDDDDDNLCPLSILISKVHFKACGLLGGTPGLHCGTTNTELGWCILSCVVTNLGLRCVAIIVGNGYCEAGQGG